MSVRSGGDPPVKFSPETTYFRVPMETVHVILVVSGPSGVPVRHGQSPAGPNENERKANTPKSKAGVPVPA